MIEPVRRSPTQPTGGGLVAFIAARLDEREAHAAKDLALLDRVTLRGAWRFRYGENVPSEIWAGDRRIGTLPPDEADDGSGTGDALLIARLVRAAESRARETLADVAAKRAFLADVARGVEVRERDVAEGRDPSPWANLAWRAACTLAAPFADDFEFDPAWRLP